MTKFALKFVTFPLLTVIDQSPVRMHCGDAAAEDDEEELFEDIADMDIPDIETVSPILPLAVKLFIAFAAAVWFTVMALLLF
jgi:hypothetical protein